MAVKRGRCLWLMNHRTLRAFEVPMLIDMGFEVFCPKKFPYDEGNLSADVTYEYDATLTIAKKDLAILNEEDFYNHITGRAVEILNREFDVVFIGFFPVQLKEIVEKFKGVIVMQPFGLSNGMTYTQVIADNLGYSFLEKIEAIGSRFFFGQAYENIAEIEHRILQNRAVYLPLGLKNAYVKDEWIGGDPRILFVCPRINTSPYFRNIYETFKKDFKGFDYLVGGAQPIKVKTDKKVAGFIPNDQYDYNMKHLSVMFYHSREKRHIHYHPFEAVSKGMPLVFMSDGLLDSLGGKELPGRCKTIKQARKKIRRIIRGDKKFIKKIKKDQGILLKHFTYEYCRKQWEKWLPVLENEIICCRWNNKPAVFPSKFKLGVLLTEGYLGGVLDVAERFIWSVKKGSKASGKNIELVFGYLKHDNFEDNTFSKIEKMGVKVREFTWKIVTEDEIYNIYKIKGYSNKVKKGRYCLLNDGVNYFEDCNYLIFLDDRVPAKLFTTRPYSVIVHDYIQRYLPQMMPSLMWENILYLQRNAENIFVTTSAAMEDGIQYGGLDRKKIYLLPGFFVNPITTNVTKIPIDEDYFIWSTNVAKHKNHLMFLEALDVYYLRGGKLKCYITGVDTENFDIKKEPKIGSHYVSEVRDIIIKSKYLSKNIVVKGNMIKENYYSVLANAKFMVHPGFADNGNGSIIDAAFMGVPSISSRYPAMEYHVNRMKLGVRFSDPFKYEEWVEMLLKSEKDCAQWKNTLPSTDELEMYTVDHIYNKIYEIVSEAMSL